MQDSTNASPNGWNPSGRCALFVCDIVSFGDQGRHDRIQRRLRDALYEGLSRSFDDSGVPFAGCYQEDRGDGVIVVPPPHVDMTLLVSPLVDRLRAELRRHNEVSSDLAKIRLRISMHSGEVQADGRGIVGTAVNHVFRLLDAPQFKEAFKVSADHVGVIVSAPFYEAVIRPGEGMVDPDDYVPIHIQNKETSTTVWMRKPVGGRPLEQVTPQEIRPRGTKPASSARPAHGRGSADEDRISLPDLFGVVDRLLAIPVMATQEGREQVVGSLRREVAVRIPRRSQANLDTYAILRTCLDFPGALGELLTIVKAFAGESEQIHALEDTIDRLVAQGE
jgi:class 3 adenylate cyclase